MPLKFKLELQTPNNYESTKKNLIALNLWKKITIYFCVYFLPRKNMLSRQILIIQQLLCWKLTLESLQSAKKTSRFGQY